MAPAADKECCQRRRKAVDNDNDNTIDTNLTGDGTTVCLLDRSSSSSGKDKRKDSSSSSQQKTQALYHCLVLLTMFCFLGFWTVSHSRSQLSTTTTKTGKPFSEIGANKDATNALTFQEATAVAPVLPTDKINDDIFCYLMDKYDEKDDDKADYDDEQYAAFVDALGRGTNDGVGRCRYFYLQRQRPTEGYLSSIDMFHNRPNAARREACLVQCLQDGHLDDDEIDQATLLEAVQLGLPKVVATLLELHGSDLDPLLPEQLHPRAYAGIDKTHRRGLNAIQWAIRGGYAETVKVLIQHSGNSGGGMYDLAIDKSGRTVADYVRLKGSPIRPKVAKEVLGIDVSNEESSNHQKKRRVRQGRRRTTDEKGSQSYLSSAKPKERLESMGDRKKKSGWSTYTARPIDLDQCDLPVVMSGDLSMEDFFVQYYQTGRPVILRDHVPEKEREAFAKARWAQTERYNMEQTFEVGPTAYPGLTDQDYCEEEFTIPELEGGATCKEMPDIPVLHAWHPGNEDFAELYPMYRGDVYHPRGSWQVIETWFGKDELDRDYDWQVFFGGDNSGATYHFHNAAFNVLYVGTKSWHIGPPVYRGLTGMPAHKVLDYLDEDMILACTQQPGDLIYIPENWGHSTMNHGFTIGAAAIIKSDHQNFRSNSKSDYSRGDYSDQQKLDSKTAAKLVTEDAPAREHFFKVPGNTIRMHGDENVPFLFVHINKTGGTSLISMFREKCKDEYVQEKWTTDGGYRHRGFHATARSYIDYYGRHTFEHAYTFAIVRHPLARQVSNFFFLADMCIQEEGSMHICRERLIKPRIDGVPLSDLPDEDKIEVFHKWIKRLYDNYPPGNEEHYLFGSRGWGNEDSDLFNATQTSWVVDDFDAIAVKRIFKLEDLSNDMSQLAEAIPCLKHDLEDGQKVELIHENTTPKYPNFMLFAKNKKTNAILREVYAPDFQNFGYSLD